MEGILSPLPIGTPLTVEITMFVTVGGILQYLHTTIGGEELWIPCLVVFSGAGEQQTYSTWQEEQKGSSDI